MSKAKPQTQAPWRAGLKSARVNLVPGLVLQAAALAVVVAYYQHEPSRVAFNRLVTWRNDAGVIFAMFTTGLFGGLLPALYLKSRRATREQYAWTQAAALTGFWFYKGFEVDTFYRLLAAWFGEGHEVRTIASKMFVDQFIYCPLLAVPVSVLFYDWVQTRFDRNAVIADVRRPGWFHRRLLPVLISNAGVWLPTTCIIYALPTALQLPLQNLVLCFFTLLIAHQTRRTV